MKINIKESEFVLKNDILKVDIGMNVSKLKSKKESFEVDKRQYLKSNDIENFFRISCQNIELFKKLDIAIPISYIDIPAEMEDYRKYYDKFINIVNEYIHNVEQSKTEKST